VFDIDLPADLFAGLANAGDAINAPAARQLIKTNPLLFMILSSLFIPISTKRAVPSLLGTRDGNAPADFCLELARRTSVSWLQDVADAS
jgi:hypothetical protein